MSLEQSMQVSTATLRAATTRHCHTDRVSGGTYQPMYFPSPAKGREVRKQKHSTGTNGTQRQTAHSTVAHRGKTQLNFSSETQQSFGEHNNLLENTTIFSRTPQFFSEHNEIS